MTIYYTKTQSLFARTNFFLPISGLTAKHFNFVAGRIELPSVGFTEGTISEDEHGDVVEEDQAQIRIRLNIVFVTAEAAPYSKTGGLGDVCGSLPIALAARGHRVMVVSPRYLHGVSDVNIARAADLGSKIKISCFGGEHEVSFFQEYRAGVDWVRISLFILAINFK